MDEQDIELEGKVVSGVNEGQYFLALEGYKSRFLEKFGFEPFEGTLNVRLEGDDLEKYERLKEKQGENIESFEEGGKRFGGVKCFPSSLEKKDGKNQVNTNTLIIVPEKTRYEKVMEIVSEFELRDKLDLKDGDKIKVYIRSV